MAAGQHAAHAGGEGRSPPTSSAVIESLITRCTSPTSEFGPAALPPPPLGAAARRSPPAGAPGPANSTAPAALTAQPPLGRPKPCSAPATAAATTATAAATARVCRRPTAGRCCPWTTPPLTGRALLYAAMAAGGYFPFPLGGYMPFNAAGMPPELAQLLNLGPRPAPPDHPGVRLLEAAERGDADGVAELLATGPDQCTTDDGRTALLLAAYKVQRLAVCC